MNREAHEMQFERDGLAVQEIGIVCLRLTLEAIIGPRNADMAGRIVGEIRRCRNLMATMKNRPHPWETLAGSLDELESIAADLAEDERREN
jgi:hypothetical protein